MDLHELLPGDPSAPALARGCLRQLRLPLPSDALDNLEIVATELVTNSLRHSGIQPGDRITLDLEVKRGLVRLEVTDQGRGFEPPARAPGPFDIGGRGLMIVDELCRDWGVQVSPSGCLVWCEIAS